MKHPYFFITLLSLLSFNSKAQTLPKNFTYLADIDPSIIQEMRYFGNHNFIGKKIDGYLAPKCILTIPAAKALAKVQAELKTFSMSLKVYDCYRPTRAVEQFIAWSKDPNDVKMKAEFYPKLNKNTLFRDGYISEKSGHSRGSTVDLTIVELPLKPQETYHEGDKLRNCALPASKRFKDNSVDFGTGYDCLDPLSHPTNPHLGMLQKQRRLMFKSLMEKNGFRVLPTEWWHYTLNDEPFPDQYFDFEIR
jgi:D-alanyl-D-alanine dipeptidase